MSQWEKLLQKILSLSNDLRFKELQKILENYGYKMNTPKTGSSHYTFRKPGFTPITIPKNQSKKFMCKWLKK